jgi:hypothetical protein
VSDAPGPDRRDGEVPRLPRGPWLRLGGGQLYRIGSVALLLVAVVALRRPCADGVASFIGSFDPPPDAGPAEPEIHYERLTEEEIRKRFPGGEADAGPVTPGR